MGVLGRICHGVKQAGQDVRFDSTGSSAQRPDVDPTAVDNLFVKLAKSVVLALGDLSQSIDGVSQTTDGIVEEKRAVAVRVRGAGAPARCVVGMGGAIGSPQSKRVIQGDGIATSAVKLADEATLDVVACTAGAFVRRPCRSDGLHELAHAVV
ncbi:hypothetical protein D3C71_1476640 [compost metagenome]